MLLLDEDLYASETENNLNISIDPQLILIMRY